MDITERLRALYVEHGTNYVQEAADEIERLRACISDGAKWVTVEERVPADDKTVLVCLHPGQIVTGWWAPGINEWRDCSNGARFVDMGMNVTHWMPLPEAPK